MVLGTLLQAAPVAPAAAAPAEVTGQVRLRCVVRAEKLEDCKTISETPPGRGFARAAVAMARKMTVSGKEGRSVNLPIDFEMSTSEADLLGIIPPGSPPRVEEVKWLRRARPQDLVGLYPSPAAKKEIEGYGLVRCTVAATGDLHACRSLQERPAGEGFAAVAVKAAERFFKVALVDEDGQPTPGRPIDVTVHFKLAYRR